MEYTIDYFIKKFEAIPEELWITDDFGKTDKHCAWGHCERSGGELSSLLSIFHTHNLIVLTINDGRSKVYQQPTPKQRILAALYDFKKQVA